MPVALHSSLIVQERVFVQLDTHSRAVSSLSESPIHPLSLFLSGLSALRGSTTKHSATSIQ